MKKIVVPMLAMMLMITVVACGKNSGEGETLQSVIGEETAMETELTEVGVDVLDYDGHSFACFFGCSTWEEARDQCESMGGHLAVITSQEEDEAFKISEMPHVFRGIFVKPVLLFADEKLEYRIMRGGEILIEGSLQGSDDTAGGRFARLNRVILDAARAEEGWQEEIVEFGKEDVLLKEYFHTV